MRKRHRMARAKSYSEPRTSKRPLEHDEQKLFVETVAKLHPDLRPLLHAIPNGGGRSKAEAGRLKAEGVTKGVADVFLAKPMVRSDRDIDCGWYCEMKRQNYTPSEVQPEQLEFADLVIAEGYAHDFCGGAAEAYKAFCRYLEITPRAEL